QPSRGALLRRRPHRTRPGRRLCEAQGHAAGADGTLAGFQPRLQSGAGRSRRVRAVQLAFRTATAADLPDIVRLLADDHLGATRERYSDPLPESYGKAFEALRQIGSEVILALDGQGTIIGCLQLMILPGLGQQGRWRAQIE